jgi:hypothetical protein
MNETRWLQQPPSLRALVGIIGLALVIVVVAVATAMRPAASLAGSDVTIYATYGAKMLDGAVPYRDFAMEYPPGASVMFLLPATRAVAGGPTDGASWMPLNDAGRRYYRGFESVVAVLLAAIVVFTALTLRWMARSVRTVLLSLLLVALSPLLIGRVLTERFDVWPAVLTAATLAASVRGWHRFAAVVLGLGATAKLYPALLLPLLVILVLRRRGAREAVVVTVVAVATAVAVLLPFSLASFSGTWHALRIQFTGGLQIESLASSLLVLVRGGSDFSTQGAGRGLIRIDLVGPGVAAVTVVMDVLLVAALLLLWFRAVRSRRDAREDLLRYAAATVAIILVLGTVLSPQYIVWLVPVVVVVGGSRGVAAILLFAVAAVLTNVWIPDRYFEYQQHLATSPALLLLGRNLVLLALAAVLLLPARAGHALLALSPLSRLQRRLA